jgi:hypothetical protein
MLKEYKVHAVDNAGMLIPEYPLTTLMEECMDFQHEMLQLEFICHGLGYTALITTKYHAEFSGEGIEYSWGLSKAMYRKYPLVLKKGKQDLMLLSLSAYQRMY